MKNLIALIGLALTVSTASFAEMTSLPDGTWSGGGKWAGGDGSTGTYTATVTIKNNTIDKSVTKNGKTWKSHVVVTFGKNGFTTADGSATGPDGKSHTFKGKGFCGLTANACSYFAGSPEAHFGGTVGFGNKVMYEIGGAHKKGTNGQPDKYVHWDGKLTQ